MSIVRGLVRQVFRGARASWKVMLFAFEMMMGWRRMRMMMRNRRMVGHGKNLRMGGRDRMLGAAWRHSHRMMCLGMLMERVVHFAMVESTHIKTCKNAHQ